MYRLTVEKFEKNENYEAEKKNFQDRDFRDSSPWIDLDSHVPKQILARALAVEITDEEFAAVKKAVLGVM